MSENADEDGPTALNGEDGNKQVWHRWRHAEAMVKAKHEQKDE